MSGGAPLAPRVEEFLRVTMGCPVLQVGGGVQRFMAVPPYPRYGVRSIRQAP